LHGNRSIPCSTTEEQRRIKEAKQLLSHIFNQSHPTILKESSSKIQLPTIQALLTL